MNFKRGEVLYHPNFIYPDGGPPCNKLLLIVNKLHMYPADVVIIPCKTQTDNYKYSPNCNEVERVFYFDTQTGFYRQNTILQLYHIELKPAIYLKENIEQKRIDRLNKQTTQQEINLIINCLKRIKEDIPQEIQLLIF